MTDHIQVGTAAPRIQYVASGTQTAFTFPFPIFTAADLEVWLGNTRQVSPAYSLSGIGISAGGTVLFASPPAPGVLVTLRRYIAIKRTSDYQDDGIIRAKTINDELDFQTAAIQQVAEDAGRAVRRSFLSSNTADLTLPEPMAGRAVKWNAAGTGLENSAADADAVLTAATAQANAASASATAAHASELAAAASKIAADADAATTTSDRAAVAADKATVSADKAIVAADKAIVASDKAAAAASASAAHASEVAAAASAGGTVKITANDITSDYLSASLSAGANIALSVLNPGANETLRISASGLAVVATSGLYSDLTGKPSLGSVTPLDVDTDTALSANSDSKIASQKAVKAYVAANGGVSAVEFSALQQDVIQNYLLDSINGAWAAGSYGNGGYDAFNSDTIGANSTSQTYDGINKLYGNPGGLTQVTPTGSTFGNMTGGGNLAAAFDGVTNQAFASSASYGGNLGYVGKAFSSATSISQVIVYAPNDGNGFANAAASCTITVYGKNGVPASYSDGTPLGNTGAFTDALGIGSKTITFAAASYTHFWAVINETGASASRIAEVQYYTNNSPASMTLLSSALSPAPASAPTQVKLMVLYKAIDASTLNTDLTAEATRNGGTTWTAGTLSDTGLTMAGFKVLWTEINVSGQSSGTEVKYRIKTLNAKSQQIKGVALMTK